MAAEVEEVVVGPTRRAGARSAPDRRDERARDPSRGGWYSAGLHGRPGCRQRAAVDLAVGGQRQRVEVTKAAGPCSRAGVRAQVRAQLGGVGAARRRRPGRRRAAGRRRRRRAPARPRPRARPDGCEQRRLDLAQLDAEAADLHLVVDAAQVLELAVGQAAGQVAGAVEPRRRRAERDRARSARRSAPAGPR